MNKNAQTQLFLSDYYSRTEREWVKHIVQPEIDYFFANSGGWMETLVSFVILLFIFYEIGRLCPYLRRTAKVWRTLTLFLIAFIYSFMSGAFFSHFFGQKYLEQSDYLIEFYQNNVFPHNPTYLIDEGEYAYFAHLFRPIDTALSDSVQTRRLTMKTILSQDSLLSRHRNSVMLEVLKTVYPRHSSGRYN